MSRLRFKDLPSHTRCNCKVVLRNLPRGFAEPELRVLLGRFNDHIKWLQFLPDVGLVVGSCCLQLDSEDEMNALLKEFHGQKFFDGKGCEFVTQAEVALHQKVSEVHESSGVRVEESKDYQDFVEKFQAGRVDYFKIETDPLNVSKVSALVTSLNSEERLKAADSKTQTKAKSKQWRSEPKTRRWVKKTSSK
jgi:hypothetical protein